MPDNTITPEQLAALLPRVMTQVESALKDKVASIVPRAARYDTRLGAVIYDSSQIRPDGTTVRLRSFLIMTKPCIISINANSTTANADVVFEEARGIVSTLNVDRDQKMPASWIDRLKQLLTQ